jgi:hypothetical protein
MWEEAVVAYLTHFWNMPGKMERTGINLNQDGQHASR